MAQDKSICSYQRTLPYPPEHVFEYMSDLTKFPDWLGELSSVYKIEGPVETTPGEKPKLDVGTKYKQYEGNKDKPTVCEMLVSTFDPPKKFGADYDDAIKAGYRITVDPTEAGGNSSNLTIEVITGRSGIFGGIIQTVLPFFFTKTKWENALNIIEKNLGEKGDN